MARVRVAKAMATVMRVVGDKEAMAMVARAMGRQQWWQAIDGDGDEEGDGDGDKGG